MDQNGVAGRMAHGVVDLLEAVEVDMQEGGTFAVLEVERVLGQNFVQVAAVGQAGQRVVHRGIFDALAGGLQLDIARLGQLARLAQFLVAIDVVGHIPVHAHDTGRLARILVNRADRSDVAGAAAGQHETILGIVFSAGAKGLGEIAFRAFPVLGVDDLRPVRIVALPGPLIAIELVHARVPVKRVFLDIEFPDADLRRLQRKTQPP